MKTEFNKKVAKEIAKKSFGYVLDCILDYSDSQYGFNTSADEFEQNFEEDLEERGIVATERRIKIIRLEYEKLQKEFEAYLRKKYYK